MAMNVTYRSFDFEPTSVSGGSVGVLPVRVPEREIVSAIIGKWKSAGHTLASPDAQAAEFFASDWYEWGPGGFFVVHSANGRIGEANVGGVASISVAAASKQRQSQFFRIPGICSQSL